MTGILGAATCFVIGQVSLAGGTASGGSDGSAVALNVTSSGTITGNIATQTWLPSGSAANYDVRATLQSGSTPTGTLGTWLNCGTTRTWTLTDTGGDSNPTECSLLIEIRFTGGGTTIDSATYTISALVIEI